MKKESRFVRTDSKPNHCDGAAFYGGGKCSKLCI